MMADPERERTAAANFGAQLSAAAAMSPTDAVMIGQQGGPEPVLPGDLGLRPEQ